MGRFAFGLSGWSTSQRVTWSEKIREEVTVIARGQRELVTPRLGALMAKGCYLVMGTGQALLCSSFLREVEHPPLLQDPVQLIILQHVRKVPGSVLGSSMQFE